MIKRKGQIVPRFIAKAVEKKSQHLLTFGCDVEINHLNKEVRQLTDGSIFRIPSNKYILQKKNKKTVKGFYFSFIKVIGLGKETAPYNQE